MRGGDAAFGHHRVRFAEQRFAHQRGLAPGRDASTAARSPAPPAPITSDVVLVGFVLRFQPSENLKS